MRAAWLQVQDMLEQAGFSRANPYNIVQQGKIAELSQMSPAQRLGLLKVRTVSLAVLLECLVHWGDCARPLC